MAEITDDLENLADQIANLDLSSESPDKELQLLLGQGANKSTETLSVKGKTSDDAFKIMMRQYRSFFNSPMLRGNTYTASELNMILDLIQGSAKDDHAMRHQFLLQLAQTKFFDMQGPVTGAIMASIRDQHLPGSITVNNNQRTWEKLVDLLEELLIRIPGVHNTLTRTLAIIGLLDALPDSHKSPKLVKQLKEMKLELEKPETLLQFTSGESTGPWQADLSFVNEDIIPELNALLSGKLDDKYLNIVKGKYDSIQHYLENWYHLMREDFLSPLRKAIKEFKDLLKPEDAITQSVPIDDGFHYYFECLREKDTVNGEPVYLFEFAMGKLTHVDWENTDRLKTGSLLALSHDHFSSVHYVVVIQHSEKPARTGRVWVSVLNQGSLPSNTKFQAIEPAAFYEPYKCVLTRLRNWTVKTMHGSMFPMQRYLVECKEDVRFPEYLKSRRILLRRGRELTLSSTPCDFPGLYLDDSQKNALHHALTHELAIVQGPPGTGKSYIGAHVVDILMLNKPLWTKFEHGCILLMAFTNHAIDQFLLECEQLGTPMSKAVRIGSRGDERTDKYNLKQRRQELRVHYEYRKMFRESYDVEKRMNRVKADIRACYSAKNKSWSVMDLETVMENAGRHYSRIIKPTGLFLGLGLGRVRPIEQRRTEDVLKWLTGKTANKTDGEEIVWPNFDGIEPMTETEVGYLSDDISALSLQDRARLFGYWCEITKTKMQERIPELKAERDRLSRELQDLQQDLDLAAVRTCDIVAMTTTGASKYSHIVEATRPTIVLVEEAAEVVESHIVAPLTSGCQHLIMIGDHQQLRPGIAEFQLERRNLSISLFERMINNQLPNEKLQVQHRMHPQISDLLVPHIYTVLQNHDKVHSFPAINGMGKRMVFLQHENLERQAGEKSSRSNPFEAKFLVSLCRYLLLQGYSEKDISIIATYTGQVTAIKEEMERLSLVHPNPFYTAAEKYELLREEFADLVKFITDREDRGFQGMTDRMRTWFDNRKHEYDKKLKKIHEPRSRLPDVQVTTVDNYQGEENKIILLSMVRSNQVCNIGYLKWPNRICVALSRAKYGFYAVGNFELFARSTKSDLWKKLNAQLQARGDDTLSRSMSIVCTRHHRVRSVHSGDEILETAPDGGCREKCGKSLPCGHQCTMFCHIFDANHTQYHCKEPCTGLLTCGHKCSKVCHQTGDDKKFFSRHHLEEEVVLRKCRDCGKPSYCETQVPITPPCGHTSFPKCSQKDGYTCDRLVATIALDCGHLRRIYCYDTDRGTIDAVGFEAIAVSLGCYRDDCKNK